MQTVIFFSMKYASDECSILFIQRITLIFYDNSVRSENFAETLKKTATCTISSRIINISNIII